MRVVNPAVRDAVKVLKPVLGVCPESALKSVRGSVSVSDFADILNTRVVEAINGVLSSAPGVYAGNSGGVTHCPVVVKDENVAALLFLVVNQRENIDVSEFGECRFLKDLLDCFLFTDIFRFPLQAWKHPEILVR